MASSCFDAASAPALATVDVLTAPFTNENQRLTFTKKLTRFVF
jgi:hypothetical protein